MQEKVNILIIGAGPAGLAVAGRCRKLDLPFEIIEKSDKIALSWHDHYDRLCLHTVKQYSHLPHLPFPDSYPLYVPKSDLIQYYEQYAQHFNINPVFKQTVTAIKKTASQRWIVQTDAERTFDAKHVVVATGVNRVPHSPNWEGQEAYKGLLMHSRTYKNTIPFLGKRVLIIGMGNTGAEVALDLVEHDVETCISVRSPLIIVPRDFRGRPIQLTAKKLAVLPFGLGDWVGAQVRKMVFGDLTKYGLPMSKVSPAVQLRKTGKTPVIDLGTLAHIKSGKIKILPDIKGFHSKGVILPNGTLQDFDAVILATGYRAQIEDFVESGEQLLDKFGLPAQVIAAGYHKGLYFVGFDNYKLGGILGTIYKDSEIAVETIYQQEQTN